MNINKLMFFAYLEGFTQSQRLMVGDKLPRHRYRKTSYRAWLKQYKDTIEAPTEEEMEEWLTEFLA